MSESILVQVGQCGNQVGFLFWQSLLQEYRCQTSLSDIDLCQFLKPKKNAVIASDFIEENYSARGVLIDMEESVINEGCRSQIGRLFQRDQILKDVSGSGNNWATGYLHFGQKYKESLSEMFQHQAEPCDNLESFLFTLSLSGGTGSGLGTYALEMISDMFPKTSRITFGVFPSDIDDVITSPYNASLCNSLLLEHSNIIVPFENQTIGSIFSRLESNKFLKKRIQGSAPKNGFSHEKPFDKMNTLIVNTIIDLTSLSRYRSKSNKSFKTLVCDLSPGNYRKYVIPSISPIIASDESSIEQLFKEVFSENNCLFECDSDDRFTCATAIFGRGEKLTSTVVENNLESITRLFNEVFSQSNSLFCCDSQQRFTCGVSVCSRGEKFSHEIVKNNLERLNRFITFPSWMNANIQHGECGVSSSRSVASVVMLDNSSTITRRFEFMKMRLQRMYERKAHLHHYIKEDPDILATIEAALTKLDMLIENYDELKNSEHYA